MDPTMAYRGLALSLAANPLVRRALTVNGRRLALRFVAGETLDDALRVADRLYQEGILTILNLLGEMVRSEDLARRFKEQVIRMLDTVADRPWARYISVKLTELGVDISEEFAFDQLAEILERARDRGCFVRIDMEDSAHVDVTLRIYRRLRAAGFDQLGIVLQAYLRRTESDLEALLPLRPNVRVVKGAYKEPPEVAFPSKRQVDDNFLRLVRRNLGAGNYTAVATHDRRIIDSVKVWTRQAGVERQRFEFQMLYGIRPDLQRALAREGYTVRAYVPYGEDWYSYFARRIAERPENLLFVIRGVLGV
jgi:proline dehydrogenase